MLHEHGDCADQKAAFGLFALAFCTPIEVRVVHAMDSRTALLLPAFYLGLQLNVVYKVFLRQRRSVDTSVRCSTPSNTQQNLTDEEQSPQYRRLHQTTSCKQVLFLYTVLADLLATHNDSAHRKITL